MKKKIKSMTAVLFSTILIVSTIISGTGVAFAEETTEPEVDQTPPAIQSIKDVFETSTYIEGQVSESASIVASTSNDGGQTWNNIGKAIKTDDQNKFTIQLEAKLAIGTHVKIIAVDASKNKSNKTIIVKADVTAPKLLNDIAVKNTGANTIFSGQLNEVGTVDILDNGVSLLPSAVETEADGSFTVTVPFQKENKKLSFVLKDKAVHNNESKIVVTVPDVTAPTISPVGDVFNTSKLITGTVSEKAIVTATVGDVIIGQATSVINNKTDEYDFAINLADFQEFGTVITIQAVDFAKPKALESTIQNIEVKKDTSDIEWAEADKVPVITENTTVVTGKVNKAATVQLFVNDEPLNATPTATDAYGNFKMNIAKQKAGTIVKVEVKDHNGNTPKVENIKVKDVTAPTIKVTSVYDTSRTIEGQVSEPAKVKIETSTDGGKKWVVVKKPSVDSIDTDLDNNFSFVLKNKLTKNTKLKITAIDGDENEGLASATVKEDFVAPKLVEPKKLVIFDEEDTEIEGTLSKEGKVDVLANGKSVVVDGKVTTDEDGYFKLTVKKQVANTKLTFVFENMKTSKPAKSQLIVTVQDSTVPVINAANTIVIKNTDKAITGTVSEPSVITATVAGKSIGKATVKSATKNEYKFSIPLKTYLEEGTEVILQAKDHAKPKALESELYPITVVMDTTKPKLVTPLPSSITDKATSISGKVDKEATVQLFVDGEPITKKPVATSASGNFKVTFSKQPAGTKIQVVIIDYAGNQMDGEVTIQVSDTTPPVIKKVNTVYDTSTYIEGQLSEPGIITIKTSTGQIVWQGTDLDTDFEKMFKIKLNKALAKNTKLQILAKDEAGNTSKSYSVTVKEDRTAPKLIDPKKMEVYDKETVVDGYLSKKGTVDVLENGVSILDKKVKTRDDGYFVVTIPAKKADTKLVFVFEDTKAGKPNKAQVTVTVLDGTKPVIESVEDIFTNSSTIKGIVSEAATVTATVNGKSIGKYTIKKTNEAGVYEFVIPISKTVKLETDTEIELIAKDFAKPRALESELRIEKVK